MERNKKNIAIIILIFALISSGMVNIYVVFDNVMFNLMTPSKEITTLKIGTMSGPWDLDPVRAWDSTSNDVIEQVCEGLYMYNLSDPDLGIVPRLASGPGIWDITGTHFTVPLRRNVWFHDGTSFNAAAVNFTFSRINWFINGTGMLPASVGISQTHSLWEFPNGTTILDPDTPVTINDEYSVTINLKAPYTIFDKLICYVNAYILSPASTPAREYIDSREGDLVGTGPFVYDYYIAATEVKFHRWNRYWRTGAYFEDLTFMIIYDSTTRYNAITSHSVDYLLGGLPSFVGSDIQDFNLTLRSEIGSLAYYYLGMNNKKINQTWRQAISHAINYTCVIDELLYGIACRSNGPIAPDFPGYNKSIQAAVWDLAKSRSIVMGMFPVETSGLIADNTTTGINADAWKALSLQDWSYFYNSDNPIQADFGVLLTYNLDQIGIDVLDEGWSWSDFIYLPWPPWYNGDRSINYDWFELYWSGWGPDYLSPYDMIYPLFSNQSVSNYAQYHNHAVEMWLDEVLSETNATKREILYSKILHQMVEVDMPHAFLYHPYQNVVHSADIKGVPYNAMGSFYAYPMYRDSDSV